MFFHSFDFVEIDKVAAQKYSKSGRKQIRLEIEREPLEEMYLDGVFKDENRNCLEMTNKKFPNHEVFIETNLISTASAI